MIGRNQEIKTLQEALDAEESRFVAIYGRRRVGKTFLVNEMFGGRYAFQHTGVEKVGTREQLAYFRDSLLRYGHRACPRLKNWREAFFELREFLETIEDRKKIVFIDEVPWLDTAKSGFLPALEHFWNGWVCLRKDVLLVICGSATSWVVTEVLSSRGGLHNRVTTPILVEPFSLHECEEYARWKRLPFNRSQIAECYMAFGGVAYYWSLLSAELSAAQNFDRMFFARNAPLASEFDRLFKSLFKVESRYVEIVNLLARKPSGLTREELLDRMAPPCGGEISRYLRELEECGFVLRCSIVGTVKKGAIYKLVDSFVLFHNAFMMGRKGNDETFWVSSYNTPKVNTWRGYAFERLCFGHVRQIKQALGISGMRTDVYSWRAKADSGQKEDAQIDMLIERADRMITICEMKFCDGLYSFSGEEARKLRRRGELFREATQTRKSISFALVTPVGLKRNEHAGDIQTCLTFEDLFK